MCTKCQEWRCSCICMKNNGLVCSVHAMPFDGLSQIQFVRSTSKWQVIHLRWSFCCYYIYLICIGLRRKINNSVWLCCSALSTFDIKTSISDKENFILSINQCQINDKLYFVALKLPPVHIQIVQKIKSNLSMSNVFRLLAMKNFN